MRRVWGWGKRDGSPQGSGRRRQRPPCGALPGGTERPCKQSQEGDDPGSKQGTEAPRLPHESSTVACATPAPGQTLVRAEGKPSPRAGAPGGCAPRRPCRAATAFPGLPRPQASRRFRRLALRHAVADARLGDDVLRAGRVPSLPVWSKIPRAGLFGPKPRTFVLRFTLNA